MDRLKGKVALVTGAGRMGNIGVAICEAFLREGAAAVIGTDIRAEQQQEIEAHLATAGEGKFLYLQQDVTSEADWRRVADQAIAAFGQLDVLVNNAGIALEGGVLDTTLDSMRQSMAINHDAMFLGTKICAPLLESAIERHPGGGSIVNTVSMASYMPSAHHLGYHTSKAAARMLTLCTAAELGPKRIRVNSVHPGYIDTPMVSKALIEAENGNEVRVQLIAAHALGRLGRAEEIANAIVFLASDESSFMTGSELVVDGGYTAA